MNYCSSPLWGTKGYTCAGRLLQLQCSNLHGNQENRRVRRCRISHPLLRSLAPVALVTRGDSNAWAINVPPTRKFEGRANYSGVRKTRLLKLLVASCSSKALVKFTLDKCSINNQSPLSSVLSLDVTTDRATYTARIHATSTIDILLTESAEAEDNLTNCSPTLH